MKKAISVACICMLLLLSGCKQMKETERILVKDGQEFTETIEIPFEDTEQNTQNTNTESSPVGSSNNSNNSGSNSGESAAQTVTVDIGYSYDKISTDNGINFEIKIPSTKLKEISAAQFGLSTAKDDNTESWLLALDYCKRNPGCKLVIPKGEYHFYSSSEVDLTISAMNDTLIEGNGSTFVYRSTASKWMSFVNCNRVCVKNLCIDYDWSYNRLADVVRIKAIDVKNKTVDWEFIECDTIFADMKMVDINKMVGDSLEDMVVGDEEYKYTYLNKAGITGKTVIDGNVLRVKYTSVLNMMEVGEYYLLRHYDYGANAFVLSGCSDFSFKGINIWSVPGMAYSVGSLTTRFQFVDCNVMIKPGSGRHISSTVDGIHIGSSSGYWRVENCRITDLGDDSINVYNSVAEINKIENNKILVLRRGKADVGDTLIFNTYDYIPLNFSAKVVSVESVGTLLTRVTLNKEMPSQVRAGGIVFNEKLNGANYLIKNNTFGRNRARGTVLGCGNGMVEGNTYLNTQHGAILVIADIFESWCEGTGVDNLVIRNNTFKNCASSNVNGVVDLAAKNAGVILTTPIFKNITLENNIFEHFPGYAVSIQSSSDIKLKSNTISNPNQNLLNLNTRGMIFVKHAKNVSVIDNVWNNSPYMNLSDYVSIVGDVDLMKPIISGNVVR